MRVRLQIHRHGSALYEGSYDVADAESFGKACADAWEQVQAQRAAQVTSVGALFDTLDQRVVDEWDGVEISLAKA